MPLSINQLMEDAKLLNEDELIELNQFIVGRIKHERNIRASRLKRQLFIGTRVSFKDNSNRLVEGKVTKIMRKFAKVNADGATWRVPINLLTKVAA